LFGEGEKCPGGGAHATVSLAEPDGRNLLDEEVWGPDPRARELRKMARAGAGGATAGGILESCNLNGCDVLEGCSNLGGAGEALLYVLAIVVAAVVIGILVMVLYWLIKTIVQLVRDKLDTPKPHGALLAPPRPKARAVQGRGTVRRSKMLDLPWKEGKASAYLMELHEKRVFGGGAMLRDAEAAGFDIELDDGRIVRVPPGRVRFLGPTSRDDVNTTILESFVSGLDPTHDTDRKLFPYDHAKTIVLHEGDRVEVLGGLEPSADTAAGGGYRASAGILAPVGVPVLRAAKGEAPRVRVSADPQPVDEGETADTADDVEEDKERRA
jgi:hypothetical protein